LEVLVRWIQALRRRGGTGIFCGGFERVTMSRVKIPLPETWSFSIDLPVRITDINYGRHLGNDSFVGMLHEARVRWLQQFGWTELITETVGLIMVDVAVRFKAEATFGDTLRIRMAVRDWSIFGFGLVYLATKAENGDEVARAQSGMAFFDYQARRLAGVPEGFREKVGG
jgi:acyl-CoA thioesterase FadM